MDALLLDLHYHLKNGEHAMNAHVRNRCEAEALAAFFQVAQRLGIQLTIETTAFTEGGLRETWRFIVKPEHAYANLMLLLSILLPSFISIWNSPPKPDQELELINKQIAKATLEEKQLAIEKAKKELLKLANEPAEKTPPPATTPALPAPSASSPSNVSHRITASGSDMSLLIVPMQRLSPPRVITEEVTAILSEDPKFSTRRSNFYKALLAYEKVTAVGWDLSGTSDFTPEVVVPRNDFRKFVLRTDKLPKSVVEEAVIEIVAPVIKEGGIHWKGIYEQKPISFAMKDGDFKGMVMRREISFQAGNAIRCRLEIESRLDEIGEVVVTGYSVPVVIEKIDNSGATETPQGRRQRFVDKHDGAQGDLGL